MRDYIAFYHAAMVNKDKQVLTDYTGPRRKARRRRGKRNSGQTKQAQAVVARMKKLGW